VDIVPESKLNNKITKILKTFKRKIRNPSILKKNFKNFLNFKKIFPPKLFNFLPSIFFLCSTSPKKKKNLE
jgi:hypothetical protein